MISVPGGEQTPRGKLHPMGGEGGDRYIEKAHIPKRNLRVEVTDDQAHTVIRRMSRQASHPERDLERCAHRDRVRAPALILHEAGKFPAAGRRDFVDAGDPALPAPTVDLLTGKERPFAVAEGPLRIWT